MRETFTQNRKSLLVMISMLFLAVIGGKAYAEVADNEEAGATSVSITPAEGEVTSLKDFVVTFNGYEAADWSYSKLVQITDEEGNTYTLKNGENVSDAALACSLDEAITAPGKYTLTIPKGAVKFNNVNENTNQEALVFEFTIAEPAAESLVMVSEDGSAVVDLLAAESVEKLIADQNIVVTVADENVNYMILKIGDGDTYIKTWSSKAKENGKFTFWIPIDYVLTLGVDYPVFITGYETNPDAGADVPSNYSNQFTIKGGTAQYVYSSATLVEPAELLYNQNEANFSLESAEDNKISFTFSDAVTIKQAFAVLGMGATQDCSVEMSEDNTVATIVIPSYVMTSYHQFVVSLLAEGADGQTVKGNNGEDAASYISVYVDAKFNLPEVTMVDPAPDATVEKISTIKFGYAAGIQPTWMDRIQILDKARNVVATSKDVTSVIPEEEKGNQDYIVKEVIVSFDNEISTNGVYTIVVPEGMFNLDLTAQGFNVKNNREAIFNITVDNGDNPSQAMHVSANPQEGEVGSLKDFEFTFMDYFACDWTYDVYPYISDAEGNVLVTISNIGWGEDLNQLACSLKGEITEPGTYVLTIPAGAVTYNDNPDNLNSEVTFKYTIVAAAEDDVTLDPAPGTVTEIPASIKVVFNKEEGVNTASGNPYITDAEGKVYATTLGINWDWPEWNALEIKLNDGAITAEGVYTLTIPAGCVALTDGSTNAVDYNFVYTIGNATAISNIFAAEGNVEIYNANGQLIKSGDASAIKSLAPNKMYIINGKKVIIK